MTEASGIKRERGAKVDTMQWPSVSVIVPAYKQQDFLERCLDSIEAQSYEGEVEVIVVDDGSPDEGAAVARAHGSAPRVIEQENGGVSSARNAGIIASTGEYLAFLDADDFWHKDKLRDQMRDILATHPLSLSFTRYHRVDEHGELFKEGGVHPAPRLDLRPGALIGHNFVGTSTVIAHRACFDRCGMFPANRQLLRAGQDYALWLRIALHFPMVYHAQVKTYYTVHQNNRVGTNPLKHHAGGVYALRALWEWDREGARRAARGGSLRGVVTRRSLKLCKELVRRRAQVPEAIWRELLPTLWELWRETPRG